MVIYNCYVIRIIAATVMLLLSVFHVSCWASDGPLQGHESDESIRQSSRSGIGELDKLDTQEGNAIYKQSLLGAAVRMIASLLAVLGLIVGCVFALKKLARYKGFATGGNISVISTIPLGQKKSICLVKVSNEILIIGMTSANMSLLTKMSLEDYYGKNAGNKPPAQNIYPEEIDNQGFRKLLSKLAQLRSNGLTLEQKR